MLGARFFIMVGDACLLLLQIRRVRFKKSENVIEAYASGTDQASYFHNCGVSRIGFAKSVERIAMHLSPRGQLY